MFREEEEEKISHFFEKHEDTNGMLLLLGTEGSGKIELLNKCISENDVFLKKPKIFCDLKGFQSDGEIIQRLLSLISVEIPQLFKEFKRDNSNKMDVILLQRILEQCPLVLVLDSFNTLTLGDRNSLFYTFVNTINDSEELVMIMIAQHAEFLMNMEKRIESRMRYHFVLFAPLCPSQIEIILRKRLFFKDADEFDKSLFCRYVAMFSCVKDLFSGITSLFVEESDISIETFNQLVVDYFDHYNDFDLPQLTRLQLSVLAHLHVLCRYAREYKVSFNKLLEQTGYSFALLDNVLLDLDNIDVINLLNDKQQSIQCCITQSDMKKMLAHHDHSLLLSFESKFNL
ncbi:hypothetical protein PCE1_001976 [Barthelona sp. PCE]